MSGMIQELVADAPSSSSSSSVVQNGGTVVAVDGGASAVDASGDTLFQRSHTLITVDQLRLLVLFGSLLTFILIFVDSIFVNFIFVSLIFVNFISFIYD